MTSVQQRGKWMFEKNKIQVSYFEKELLGIIVELFPDDDEKKLE